jgi:hypothetical protein
MIFVTLAMGTDFSSSDSPTTPTPATTTAPSPIAGIGSLAGLPGNVTADNVECSDGATVGRSALERISVFALGRRGS